MREGKSATSWIEATRARPCPVCGKPDWCTTTADGGTIHCRRGADRPAPPGFRRKDTASDGAARFVRIGQSDSLAFDPAIYRVPVTVQPVRKAPARPWADEAAEYAAAARDRLDLLADHLGVRLDVLEAMGVGWTGKAWSFPYRDGDGQVVGIATRLPDDKKRAVRSSSTGLLYAPDRWSQGDGPVYVVEGASDTAALTGLGLAAVGRPSNTGGAAHLARLLREWPAHRGIVVVGERDEKPDGAWPGRDGAVSVAEKLAALLCRDILWTLPPEGVKDSRAFAAQATATEIVAVYAAAAVIVPAKAPRHHEVATVPTDEPRDLQSFRDDLLVAKRTAVATVGIHVDRSPTGAGKTASTIAALLEVGRTKTVQALPTHANIAERRQEMIDGGHSPDRIGVVPKLTEENCVMFDDAEAARAAGLSHGEAVCRGCHHRNACEYLQLKAQAERRQHLITTAEHFQRSHGSKSMRGREVVIVDEKPDLTLAPRIHCSEADMTGVVTFLDRIVSEGNSRAIRSLEDWGADPTPAADAGVEVAATANGLRCMAEDVLAAMRAVTEPGAIEQSIDASGLPSGWQQQVKRVMAAHALAPPPQDAMRLLVALAAGDASSVWVTADRTLDGIIVRHALVHWRVDLNGLRVVLLDGTADVASLSRLAGHEVRDITPTGHPPTLHAVVQRPRPISRKTSAAVVRDIIEAVIEESGAARIGLIGLKTHMEQLMNPDEPDCLAQCIRDRITMHAHFGQGPDRASNEWHRDCDLLLVVGTPRPNPGDVRRLLVVQGEIEAAQYDVAWGRGTWDASKVEGGTECLWSFDYTDPAWRAAHQAITRANLLQAVGRARAGLAEGIPAIVLTDEPLGLPVDMLPIGERSITTRRVLEAMRAAETAFRSGETTIPSPEEGSGRACPKNRGESPIGNSLLLIGTSPLFLGQRLSGIIQASGLDAREVSRALRDAAEQGDVHQPAPGYWCLGPAPAEPITDAVPTGLGRPPEVESRVASTRATIERLADAAPDRIVTTNQYVEAEARAARSTAMKNLGEAVEAREVVQLDRGLYATDLPVARVERTAAARAWINDPRPGQEDSEPVCITITTRSGVSSVVAVCPAGEVETHITLLAAGDTEVPHEDITSITARRGRARR
jgi:hypothetical protein